MKPILICGGVGTKMWPLSRQKKPKHFLPLFGDQSLFEINYQVLREKFAPGEIYVQTNSEQANIAKRQAREIPLKNFFIEPEVRGQGPATLFAAAKLSLISPDEPFIIVQVDVLREPDEKWLKTISQMEEIVNKTKKLVTGGIRPKYAIMGVDYLVAPKLISKTRGVKVFKMEKWLGRSSDKREVEKYFKQKALFAHANHCCWTPKLMLECCQKIAPDWYTAIAKMIKSFGRKNETSIVGKEYGKMEKGSIERITQFELESGFVVELPFIWNDFGTWESLFRYQKLSGTYDPGNDILTIDSSCAIYKDKEQGKKFIAALGVKDLIIVDSKDGLIICHKDYAGRVGEVTEHLREKGKEEFT